MSGSRKHYDGTTFERMAKGIPQKVVLAWFKTSTKVVRDWERAGMPRNPDKSYNLFEVVPWIRDRLSDADLSLGDAPPALKIKLLEAQLKNKEIEAENRHLSLEERKRNLVSRSNMRDGLRETVKIIRDGLTGVRDRHGEDVKSEVEEIFVDAFESAARVVVTPDLLDGVEELEMGVKKEEGREKREAVKKKRPVKKAVSKRRAVAGKGTKGRKK